MLALWNVVQLLQKKDSTRSLITDIEFAVRLKFSVLKVGFRRISSELSQTRCISRILSKALALK